MSVETVRSILAGFNWTVLRGLGNSTPAKLSILAPIFGHLILFNREITDVLSSFDRTLGVAGNSITNLYCLYLGLFVVGLASIVYQVRCHRIVKRYSDEEDFVLTAGPTTTRTDLRNYLVSIEQIGGGQGDQFDWRLAKQKFEALGSESEGRGDEPVRNSIMKEYYAALARSRPFSRWGATVLYLIAFGFLAVPSLRTFFGVTRLLFASV